MLNLLKLTANGNNNTVSTSKIKNNNAKLKYLTSNCNFASENNFIPHSYISDFEEVSFLYAQITLATNEATANASDSNENTNRKINSIKINPRHINYIIILKNFVI